MSLKVSLVVTVLNEAKNINGLLDALLKQTQPPNELIFIDAGSTDNTVQLIKRHPVCNKLSVRLISASNQNRSQARNLGIKSAKHQIIALTDAGCLPEPEWLERLVKPLSNRAVQAVAGFYHIQTNSILAQATAPYLGVMPDQFNPETYLPSSRSLAITKSGWMAAGKYPENLNYCEDLIFARNLKKLGNMVIQPQAIVLWQPVSSLADFYNKIKNYATGDIQAGYWPHIIKIITTYLRYLIFFAIPFLFIAYWFWPIIKHNRYLKNRLALFLLPLIQITTDMAIFRGSLQGLKFRLSSII